jgi:AraC family transcriptional regulator
MPEEAFQRSSLKAGEFYGEVPRKRLVSSSILSEVLHKREVNVPEHSHELAYFTLVLAGGYSEKFGSNSQHLSPMSILWHRAGISHRDRIGAGGGRFFIVEVRPEGLESLSRHARVPEDFSERDGPLAWLACRLHHEFKNWQTCSGLIAEGVVLEMLAHAARQQVSGERRPPSWLLRVVERLNEEFAESFSIEELAREAKVHPVHLAAVFRQFYHETVGERVQKLRVGHASRLLLAKEMSLAEIAHAAGFSDQSHFTRVFKRYVGLTPGAFRNSLD